MKTAFLIALLLAVPASADNARVGRLAELSFDRGSHELPVRDIEKSQLELGKVAAWAMENPDGFVVIDGHADATGPRNLNVRLSLARAETVRRKLVETGVSPDQIVVAPYGEARAKRTVVVWGTRAGLDAISGRTKQRGYGVVASGVVSQADRRPAPGVPTKNRPPRPTQVTFR